jgi:hypothetical protein
MSTTGSEKAVSVFSESLENFIAALGRGIGTAQTELDRSSIETQRRIDEDPLLSQYGLQATWYQMPKTELELKIAFSLQQESYSMPRRDTTEEPAIAEPMITRRIMVEPINVLYSNRFGFNVNAASTVKLTIVPVPPPRGDSTLATAKLTEEIVMDKAKPDLVKEPDGVTLVKEARISVNFNAASRMWFVSQYQEKEGRVELLALVAIDDETGTIIKRIRS